MSETHPGVVKETTTKSSTRKPPAAAKAATAANAHKGDTPTREEAPMTTTTLTAAELSRRALVEAQTKAAECQALNGQAEANAAALLARVAKADTTVTAIEWATVKAGQEVAAELVKAAESAVRKAEYSLINDDFRLGDTFTDALRAIYGRFVEIKTVGERRLVTKPEDARDSVIYIVQEKPTRDTGGIWSGDLRLTYYRSAVMSALDGREIERACQDRDWGVSVRNVHGFELPDGQHEDTAQIEIRGVYPPVPVLRDAPTEGSLQELARTVSNRLYVAVRVDAPRPGIRLMNEPIERHVFADVMDVQIIGSSEADDEKRTTVEMTFQVKVEDDFKGSPRELLNRAAESCIGLAERGSGGIVAVEGFDFRLVHSEKNGKPVYVESIGRQFVVTIRFAIAYRIG